MCSLAIVYSPALYAQPIEVIGAFNYLRDVVTDATVLVQAVIPGDADSPDAISNGTGCIISSAGDVLTALHTVAGAKEITVLIRGEKHPATITRSSAAADIALLGLLVAPPDLLPHLGVNPDYRLRPLDEVLIASFPSIGITSKPSLSVGEVAAVRHTESPNTVQLNVGSELGMSGAPMVNKFGDIIGVLRSRAPGGRIGFGPLADEFEELLPIESKRRLLAPFNNALGVGITTRYGVAPRASGQFRIGNESGISVGLALGVSVDSWFSADGMYMVSPFSLRIGAGGLVSPYVGLGGGVIRVHHGSMQADSWWVHGAIGVHVRMQRLLLGCQTLLVKPWGGMAKSGQALYPVVEFKALIDLSL